MAWTTHYANANGQLDGLIGPIGAAIERARARIETVTPAVTIDVVVQSWPGRVIECYGLVGYAPTGTMMQLTVDPDNANLATSLGEPLERTIAHELHHVQRQRGPGYGRTLGGALVSEGLAGHFAGELYGKRPEPWERALDIEEIARFAAEAEKDWDHHDYDHAAWFFGSGGRPCWTGYTLGYALVDRYLGDRPTLTAASLVDTPAAAFRDAHRVLCRGVSIADDGESVGAVDHSLSSEDLVEIRELEESLWQSGTRFDRELMDAVFAADFFEFGRSGRAYGRETLLFDPSAARDIRATLPLPRFRARHLTADVVQVTYLGEIRHGETTEHARRTSIWSRENGEWRLRFHQGTPTRA